MPELHALYQRNGRWATERKSDSCARSLTPDALPRRTLDCARPSAAWRADSASCLAKATLFVTELDKLLEKEKEWDTPYPDLVKPYFPLRDCEAQAFLDVCRQSRFIRSTPAPTSISSGSNVTI
jgi:hypothetical protein